MKKYIFFVAALLVIAGGITVFTKLYAQSAPQGLMISPTNIELVTNPGDTVTKSITLFNNSKFDVDIVPETRNFTAQGEEGNVTLTSEETGYSLASWITVLPLKATIKAGKSEDFTFTMKVPANAEPGGHFGSVVLSTVPPPKGTLRQSGAYVLQQLGALILVKTPGVIKEFADLESFTTNKNFYISGPVQFTTRVKNSSNVHIRPLGTISIKDMFGNKTVLPAGGLNVLPGAIRRIPTIWNNKFLIGRYTADLSMFYGDSNKNLTSTIIFYAFPLNYAIIAIIILAIIIVFRKRLIKAFRIIIIGK